jgi:signal transduction histidine kinase
VQNFKRFIDISGAVMAEKTTGKHRPLSEQNIREFLGMAVHDLRTPLHKISLASEVLLAGKVKEERKEELLQIIHRAARGMEGLISSLLDLTRMESGQETLDLKPTVLPEFFEEICADLKIIADEKRVDFQFEVLADTSPVLLDQDRVALVITNLISNAFKFSSPGDTVGLTVERNGSIVARVEDNGPGIGPEDLEKLFQPFHRGAARPTAGEQSTGLGLAICAKIVELHGGDITVESSLGEGAIFSVELPVIETEPIGKSEISG